MHRIVKMLGVAALMMLVWSDGRVAGQRLRDGGDGVLVGSEPMEVAAGAVCAWPTDWQVDELRAERDAVSARRSRARGGAAAGPSRAGVETIGGDPVRTVRDPYAAFAAVAVDVKRGTR